MPPQKDKVTRYLNMVLKGLVKEENKPEVSAEKKEYPDTKTVNYRFFVSQEDEQFFGKQIVLDGLSVITGRAAYTFYPEYETKKWQISLKKWNEPI